MVGNGAMVAVGSFACLLGSSIATRPGEAGKRVHSWHGWFSHYLHNEFRFYILYFFYCV